MLIVLFACILNMQAYAFQTHSIGVAQAMCDFENITAALGHIHMPAEHIAPVDIAPGAFSIPMTFDIGQGAFQRIICHAAIREGCIDKQESIGMGIVDAVTNINIEVEQLRGIFDIDKILQAVVHIPPLLVDIILVCIEHFAVAALG